MELLKKLIYTKLRVSCAAPFIKKITTRFVPNETMDVKNARMACDPKVLSKWLGDYDSLENNWIHVKPTQKLPKLPVPPLVQTIQTYKEKMKILLTNDQYSKLQLITKTFLEDDNLGPKLQNYLLDRQKNLDNWAYDYWIDDMYLANNTSLPIFSSPGYTNISYTPVKDVCLLGAKIVGMAIKIIWLMKNNYFPKASTLKETSNIQFCMELYYRFFTNCRIPGKDKDHLTRASDQNDNHIIVIYRNDFYYVPILMTEDRFDEDAIYNNLKAITSNTTNGKAAPVGVLTTLKRREWCARREALMRIPNNVENLMLIEKSLFVLCLDEPITDVLETLDENDKKRILLEQVLHGGGSNHNSGNRWYDKVSQIILSETNIGYCMEHSSVDGVTTTILLDTLFRGAVSACKNYHPKLNKSTLQSMRLNWVLPDDILETIENASHDLDKTIDDLDMQVYNFKNYGSRFIKSYKCSPDGFVQLLLQLAYFRIYGKLCSTYESGSTRKFRRGRIDCIRATTPEMFEWVKEMDTPKTNTALRLKLFRNAVKAQMNEARKVISGYGIDIHLLGLRKAAKEILNTTPELFSDQSYTVANEFVISTSQTGNIPNAIWSFGPVVNQGYGVSYSIHADRVELIITSMHSCKTTSTKKFVEILDRSFDDVKTMLEQGELKNKKRIQN